MHYKIPRAQTSIKQDYFNHPFKFSEFTSEKEFDLFHIHMKVKFVISILRNVHCQFFGDSFVSLSGEDVL